MTRIPFPPGPQPRSRHRRLAVAGAAALFAFGLAGPAVASGGCELTISPNSGPPGTAVTVKTNCQPISPARSDAFKESISLSQSNGVWSGSGHIKSTDVLTNHTYPVTVDCENGETLTTNFTVTPASTPTTVAPTGGASAGFGGQATSGGAGTSGSTQATALAVGGSVALAGAAGYAFLARRRSSGTHSY